LKPRSAGTSAAPYLSQVAIERDRVEDWTAYPFRLPFVRNLTLTFTSPVTFLIGENGSGKTTLLEAIAQLCRLPVRGGGRTELASGLAEERSALASALRLLAITQERTNLSSPVDRRRTGLRVA
jgi:predicted ATPase